MNTRIYWKWYRETSDKIQPWKQLESLCNQHPGDIKFEQIIIPWEPDDNKKRLFSGIETRRAIIDHLLAIDEPAILNFYSLQTWEGLNATIEVADKIKDLIIWINLMNSPRNAAYTISSMDWASSNLEKRINPEKYLTENPKIFSRLMQPAGKGNDAWRWNPEIFQKDLQWYHKEFEAWEWIDYKVEHVKDLGIACNVFEWQNDVIANEGWELKSKKRALYNHIPKKTLMSKVFHSFD